MKVWVLKIRNTLVQYVDIALFEHRMDAVYYAEREYRRLCNKIGAEPPEKKDIDHLWLDLTRTKGANPRPTSYIGWITGDDHVGFELTYMRVTPKSNRLYLLGKGRR